MESGKQTERRSGAVAQDLLLQSNVQAWSGRCTGCDEELPIDSVVPHIVEFDEVRMCRASGRTRVYTHRETVFYCYDCHGAALLDPGLKILMILN